MLKELQEIDWFAAGLIREGVGDVGGVPLSESGCSVGSEKQSRLARTRTGKMKNEE